MSFLEWFDIELLLGQVSNRRVIFIISTSTEKTQKKCQTKATDDVDSGINAHCVFEHKKPSQGVDLQRRP